MERRRTFGISLDPELAERIDVLQPKIGRRSMFIADTLEIGLERRFGPNWREMADQLRAQKGIEQGAVSA
jgi:metal-responsive CopG/Arc/MetJ family transcriptional regulator